MKDGLDLRAAKRVANAISAVYPAFNGKVFVDEISLFYQPLELKERVEFFVKTLAKLLPADFVQCHDILIQLKRHWDKGDPTDATRTFAAWPILEFIAVYGLNHQSHAYALMHELTELFSAEFTIRHFIKHEPKTAFHYLNQWVNDKNHHVRRLVSEGSRPRLPWGIRLHQFCQDPTPCLPLLTKLKNDPSEYVRRSVANHLNDIAKDNPKVVINICKSWQNNASDNTLWVIKHACRSLVKAGYQEVFPLLGFTEKPEIKVSPMTLAQTSIKLGESLHFSFDINSFANKTQQLAVDFVIHHVKANGKLTAKVFKLKTITIQPNQQLRIEKKHQIKAVTTRKYYQGQHQLDIQINGKLVVSTHFNLSI